MTILTELKEYLQERISSRFLSLKVFLSIKSRNGIFKEFGIAFFKKSTLSLLSTKTSFFVFVF